MENLVNQEVIDILEERIQSEEFSVRLYRQMSLWLRNTGFAHLAALYDKYSGEELNHAKWASDFLLNLGVTPKLRAVQSPYMEFESVMNVLEATLEHEHKVLNECEAGAFKALSMKNMALYNLYLKYCAEQNEEVGKSIDLIDHAKLTEDMLVLDHYVERYL